MCAVNVEQSFQSLSVGKKIEENVLDFLLMKNFVVHHVVTEITPRQNLVIVVGSGLPTHTLKPTTINDIVQIAIVIQNLAMKNK